MPDDYSRFLHLFAVDKQGQNFREYVQSIDYGYGEFWSILFVWNDYDSDLETYTVRFLTQYNPPRFCREGNECMHFPRNHLDDCVVDYTGDLLESGACPL
jgi:hypothetical protein